LLAFSLVPVAIVLTLTITFFLNGMSGLGLLFILLTMVVFVASLFVVPASLVALASTGDLGRALNPSGIVEVVKKGGRPYMTLAAFSVVTGLACMVVTIMSVFLVEIPLAGLVVSGLLMALVFSYGHFLWFHLLGRFAGQNMSRPGALATAARA